MNMIYALNALAALPTSCGCLHIADEFAEYAIARSGVLKKLELLSWSSILPFLQSLSLSRSGARL